MTPTGEHKQEQWGRFAERLENLRKRGRRGLRKLSEPELSELMDGFQALTADLARARSLGAPASTVQYLNRLAVTGHSLLYGYSRPRQKIGAGQWYTAFPRAVRSAPGAVLVAFAAFWVPAVISYLAVQLHPALAFDLVPPGFYTFHAPSAQHMHNIPQLMRPLVASSIIANNIQVTFLAFALGITAGIGTTLVLIFNGVQIGAVAGWMSFRGQGRALWGWVLPHGGTELLAICLAGAAGYLLAGALICPGLATRLSALRRAGAQALVIESGCMAMLGVAGLIEGLVSPSSLPFAGRLAILIASLLLWGSYLLLAGRTRSSSGESLAPEQWY